MRFMASSGMALWVRGILREFLPDGADLFGQGLTSVVQFHDMLYKTFRDILYTFCFDEG